MSRVPSENRCRGLRKSFVELYELPTPRGHSLVCVTATLARHKPSNKSAVYSGVGRGFFRGARGECLRQLVHCDLIALGLSSLPISGGGGGRLHAVRPRPVPALASCSARRAVRRRRRLRPT